MKYYLGCSISEIDDISFLVSALRSICAYCTMQLMQDALHIYTHYGIVYLPNKGFGRDTGTLMIYTLNSDGSLF
jgi:hypothetical protein